MTDDTSAAGVGPHRWPLPSTTRTVLVPKDFMSANALVRFGYQTWAWLTPRITNGVPFASTTRVPSTCRPGAAGGCVPRAATTAGYQRLSIFWMPVVVLGWTPSVVSVAVLTP